MRTKQCCVKKQERGQRFGTVNAFNAPVAKAAVRSEVVVLLLLIFSLVYFPWAAGVL